MLTFAEARAELLRCVPGASSERVSLQDAAGRVLAEEVVAREPLPLFEQSAMDGYAVVLADLAGDPPWELPVAGESRAGAETPPIAAGSARRIFTGASVPRGADAVIMQEHVVRDGETIRLQKLPVRGQNIRRAGEDIDAGVVALRPGSRLTAGGLALAAMLDRADLLVARRPRVTVLCTGNELRSPGTEAAPATIPESNSVAVAALARQAGADVTIAPLARDDAETVERAVESALGATDVLVTVGGVSVGDHDVVRPALERVGVTIAFWRVAIKPGKPLVLGRRGGAHVLGLPGNPASALVTFALFGVPLIRALQGDACPVAAPFGARLEAARKRGVDRLEFVRARLRWTGDGFVATADDNQASGAATSLASSDGLAFVPAGTEPVAAGTRVDFLRWADA